MNDLERLLHKMIELNASDIHLNHNAKISFRIDGNITQTEHYIEGDDIFALALFALNNDQTRRYHEEQGVDFSYRIGKHRFRGSLIYQKGQPSMVIRKVESDIIPFEKSTLPPKLKEIVKSKWGLVLVTGPTGSGKSTSLASIIDYINKTEPYHIATIEQPIEYVHQNHRAIITQREVGKDTPSFAHSMRDVLRQDPDVILIGEMRDLETISSAVTNAETGHLVLGTMHTNTAPHSINRILDVYPSELRNNVRGQLASNLKAVLNQRLFPRPGGGRTPIYELMIVNEEMREAIRQDRLQDLYKIMEKYKHEGNILMKDSIRIAQSKGLLYPDVVW